MRWCVSMWSEILFGAGVGLVVGVAQAILAASLGNLPTFHEGGPFYLWILVFCPGVGGTLGAYFFNRRERRRERMRAAGRCGTCGYSLTGNVSGTCPECGTPVPKRTSDAVEAVPTVKNEQC